MIDPSLLARLRKADLGAYKQIEKAIWAKEMAEELEYECDEWGHRCKLSLPDCYEEAVLQAILQDAIRTRKRYFSMTQTTPGPRGEQYRASIRYRRNYVEGEVRLFGEDPWPQLAECNGNSPAETLLRAYLAALDEVAK